MRTHVGETSLPWHVGSGPSVPAYSCCEKPHCGQSPQLLLHCLLPLVMLLLQCWVVESYQLRTCVRDDRKCMQGTMHLITIGICRPSYLSVLLVLMTLSLDVLGKGLLAGIHGG